MTDEIEEPPKVKRTYLKWDPIIVEAAKIVESYDIGVTLRQLFYRLVSAKLIPNSKSAYKQLSTYTAEARRQGWFPDLVDNTRYINRPWWADSAEAAAQDSIDSFRYDRTAGQKHSVYVAVEKHALGGLLAHWYRERGIPVLSFGGYPSQTFVKDIQEDVERQGRPAVLIYGGDFDATGVDIPRDFLKRTEGCWAHYIRIGLNFDQIEEFDLPPLEGKWWDPRAAKFESEHGKLMQVELDALPPDALKKIYEDEVAKWWEPKIFEEVVEAEKKEKKKLILPSEVNGIFEALRKHRNVSEAYVDFMEAMSFEHDEELLDALNESDNEAHEIIQKYEGVFDDED